MIRINRGSEVKPGVFSYAAVGLPVRGTSRQPLLDACRQIIALIGPTAERVAIFREGQTMADMACPVEVGANLTVSERIDGNIRFEKYRPFGMSVNEAAE